MEETLRASLKSQYHAALAMLKDAVERCPGSLWAKSGHKNESWRVAYHALFYAHFYGGRDEASFEPWEHHRPDVQYLDPDGGPPGRFEPYTKAQVLSYWRFCDERIDAAIDAMDLRSGESGFPWYPIPKLEHQIVNIRHIQHHTAQLADRVRTAVDEGVDWVGARRPPR
ncbi:MAG TPA: DinB family protein [Planctomycetota bacterium]|nr:DinB family protein [Planctomycetota bacterium]